MATKTKQQTKLSIKSSNMSVAAKSNHQDFVVAGSGDAPSPKCKPAVTPSRKPAPVPSSRRFNPHAPTGDRTVRRKLEKEIRKLENPDAPQKKALVKKEITPQKRSLTMTDMYARDQTCRSPCIIKGDINSLEDHEPGTHTNHSTSCITLEDDERRKILERYFFRLVYHLWMKQRKRVETLQNNISQLQVQKSFLCDLREKESSRRTEASAMVERQRKKIEHLHAQLQKASKIKEVQDVVTQNLELQVQKQKKELESLKSVCHRFQISTNECLVEMHNNARNIDKIRGEKINLINQINSQNILIAEQQLKVENLYNIAKDLEEKHTTQITQAYRERDEAMENEYTLKEENESLLQKLEMCQESKNALKEEVKKMQETIQGIEEEKLNLSLDGCHMEMKMQEMEKKLNEIELELQKKDECLAKAANSWKKVAYNSAQLPLTMLLHTAYLMFPILPHHY